MAYSPITDAAKELLQKQTEAEKILWLRLRGRRVCGAKFRRQEPVGRYIVDFVSFENKLVLEIDGSSHEQADGKTNDAQRTAWLNSEGFKVVRFWNREVINDIEGVLGKIRLLLKR